MDQLEARVKEFVGLLVKEVIGREANGFKKQVESVVAVS